MVDLPHQVEGTIIFGLLLNYMVLRVLQPYTNSLNFIKMAVYTPRQMHILQSNILEGQITVNLL